MVRRMAMSAVLVRTSMTRLDTMLKAATSTIMVSTRNITLVWPWIAAKKPILACHQSNTQPCMPTTCESWRRAAPTEAVVGDEDLYARDLVAEVEQALDVGQRRVDEVGVVVVHAGAEDRRHPRLHRPRHDAQRRGDFDRRDELQVVAHLQLQQVGQAAADHDREVVAEVLQRCPNRSACRPRPGTDRDSGRAARRAPRSRPRAAGAP